MRVDVPQHYAQKIDVEASETQLYLDGQPLHPDLSAPPSPLPSPSRLSGLSPGLL